MSRIRFRSCKPDLHGDSLMVNCCDSNTILTRNSRLSPRTEHLACKSLCRSASISYSRRGEPPSIFVLTRFSDDIVDPYGDIYQICVFPPFCLISNGQVPRKLIGMSLTLPYLSPCSSPPPHGNLAPFNSARASADMFVFKSLVGNPKIVTSHGKEPCRATPSGE